MTTDRRTPSVSDPIDAAELRWRSYTEHLADLGYHLHDGSQPEDRESEARPRTMANNHDQAP
jgi:hypothetical protein